MVPDPPFEPVERDAFVVPPDLAIDFWAFPAAADFVSPDLLPPPVLAIGVFGASFAPAVFFGAADREPPAVLPVPVPEAEELFEAEPEVLFEPAEALLAALPDEVLFDAPLALLELEGPELLLLSDDAALEPEPVLFEAVGFEPPAELFEPDPAEDPEELFEAELFEVDFDREPDALPEADFPVTDSITDTAAPVTAPAAAPATASPTTSNVLSYAAVNVLLFPRLAVAIVFSFVIRTQ